MDIKKLAAVEGALPTDAEPEVRYVVVGVTNGSAEPMRTLVRLVSRTEHSNETVRRLGEQNPGAKFKMLVTGRLVMCPDNNADFIMHRGSERFHDFDLDSANVLRLAFGGKRIRTAAIPPHPPMRHRAAH